MSSGRTSSDASTTNAVTAGAAAAPFLLAVFIVSNFTRWFIVFVNVQPTSSRASGAAPSPLGGAAPGVVAFAEVEDERAKTTLAYALALNASMKPWTARHLATACFALGGIVARSTASSPNQFRHGTVAFPCDGCCCVSGDDSGRTDRGLLAVALRCFGEEPDVSRLVAGGTVSAATAAACRRW